MRIGFTGTRRGMTDAQRETVRGLLLKLRPWEAHHGACHGADHDFMQLLQEHGDAVDIPPAWIVHPSDLRNWTCEHCLRHADRVAMTAQPLVRNKDIVNESDLLIACPETAEEQQRSGTWSTVRYARKCKKPIRLILPDGTVKEE